MIINIINIVLILILVKVKVREYSEVFDDWIVI